MKAEEIKLKIGELAELCHVTNRALRHYEKMNLLVPSIVDKYTGYRYYGKEEIKKLWFINRLKEQGFQLLEIKDLFERDLYNPDLNSIETHIRECKEEIALLQKRLLMLESLWSSHIKREGLADFYIDKLPAVNVAYHRMRISDYDSLDKWVMDVFLPEVIRLECQFPATFYCFSMETAQNVENGDVEIELCDEVVTIGHESEFIQYKRLPEVPLAICMRVYGPHNKLPDVCKNLCAEILNVVIGS